MMSLSLHESFFSWRAASIEGGVLWRCLTLISYWSSLRVFSFRLLGQLRHYIFYLSPSQLLTDNVADEWILRLGPLHWVTVIRCVNTTAYNHRYRRPAQDTPVHWVGGPITIFAGFIIRGPVSYIGTKENEVAICACSVNRHNKRYCKGLETEIELTCFPKPCYNEVDNRILHRYYSVLPDYCSVHLPGNN